MRYNNLNYSFVIEDNTYQISMASYNKFDCIVPSHRHSKNSFEIHYIPEGYGNALIDGVEYHISPNTLFITGPHVEHSQTPHLSNPMSEYCIYMKVQLNNQKHKDFITKSLFDNVFWFGQDKQNIHLFLQFIFQELESLNVGREQELNSLFQLLVIHVIRNFDTTTLPKPISYHQNILEEPFLLIEEQFLSEYKTLTLNDLSEKIGLSSRQTERLLKQYYNSNFQKKKTEARMAAAASLLSNTEETITIIAEKTGYSSSEYFAHAFKKFYKISASDYRKQGCDKGMG
ncbi:MAG: AraC family transcriptional regulator [Anaerocolumna sp.]